MKARLYRKTQYDRENQKTRLQNLVKNKNRKACTKIKASSVNLQARWRTLAHLPGGMRRALGRTIGGAGQTKTLFPK